MLSRSNACARRRCSTRWSSRWPAFRSSRWFRRDCGSRTVTRRLPICTGIRSATPSALPAARTSSRKCRGSIWPSTGGLDLRLLGAFATDIATGGTAQADFTVSGPLRSPDVVGRIGVTNGELRLDTPRVVASELEGSVRVDESRTATISMAGTVNGGAAEINGEIDVTTIGDPKGTRDAVGAKRGARISRRAFRRNRTPTSRSRWLPQAPRWPGASTSWAARIANRSSCPARCFRACARASTRRRPCRRFFRDCGSISRWPRSKTSASTTTTGASIVSTRLQIVGTVERPGVIGRIEASPDGEIYLAGNTYRIERLIVDFANPRAIAPDLSFLAETRVGSTPIEVELTCTASGACERDVRSQAAGVTDEQAEEQLFGVSTDPSAAGAQLARLLSGEVLGIVGRRVGLDTLRLEQGGSGDLFDDPTLIAGDVDPASRLTLGERLGDSVELVYSQNLAASGFTWSTTYYAPYGLSFRGLLLDDQSRSLEFRHEPRFGATRRGRSRASARRTDRRRALHGKSWLLGTRAARQAEADRGRPLRVRSVATRSRSACRVCTSRAGFWRPAFARGGFRSSRKSLMPASARPPSSSSTPSSAVPRRGSTCVGRLCRRPCASAFSIGGRAPSSTASSSATRGRSFEIICIVRVISRRRSQRS